jgi:predicted esterase YcpF (UPF0227 family)
MILFVLPGFLSYVPNDKFRYYVKELPNLDIIPLNYSPNPVTATIDLVKEIQEFDDPDKIFLGTSLGGFWTQFLANEFNGKSIMLNPAITPTSTLQHYIGTVTNYVTNETCELTKRDVQRYQSLYITPGLVETLILLNTEDEMLNYLKTVNVYIDDAKIEIIQGGDHRFTNIEETLQPIKDFINYEQI